jgi:hypothetical protein
MPHFRFCTRASKMKVQACQKGTQKARTGSSVCRRRRLTLQLGTMWTVVVIALDIAPARPAGPSHPTAPSNFSLVRCGRWMDGAMMAAAV